MTKFKDDFLWGLTTQEFQKMLINALEQVIEVVYAIMRTQTRRN